MRVVVYIGQEWWVVVEKRENGKVSHGRSVCVVLGGVWRVEQLLSEKEEA